MLNITKKKPIYVTTGEPAGIGPDICLQLASLTLPYPVVLLADTTLLAERASTLKIDIAFIPFTGQTTPAPLNACYVQHIPLSASVVAGQLDRRNASYVLAQLTLAAEAAMCGDCAAIVTAPVQKSIICESGISFTGHTEFFQACAGVHNVVMMLATPTLRVALATTHLPLRQVSDHITQPLLTDILNILIHDLQLKFGIAHPRIMVCGLNPHAGESGHLGREEVEVINPVLAMFTAQGFNVGEALPADTLFRPQHLQECDAVLAMYHDQGLPVLKSQGFGEAVNITLGLPFIRTSVDHGTALDLAATGKASPSSLIAAVHMAIYIADKATV